MEMEEGARGKWPCSQRASQEVCFLVERPSPLSEGPLDLRPVSWGSWGGTPKLEGMGRAFLGRTLPTLRRRSCRLKENAQHTSMKVKVLFWNSFTGGL